MERAPTQSPRALNEAAVLALQRAAGNSAVARMAGHFSPVNIRAFSTTSVPLAGDAAGSRQPAPTASAGVSPCSRAQHRPSPTVNRIEADPEPVSTTPPGKFVALLDRAAPVYLSKAGGQPAFTTQNSQFVKLKIGKKRKDSWQTLPRVRVEGAGFSGYVSPGSLRTSDSESAQRTPLFARREPAVSDVKQNKLGDCYLLAALISITHTTPAAIKSLFTCHDDGTVTVHLHSVKTTGEGKIFQKHDVHITRLTHFDTDGALWVRLIEKAYACGGFAGSENKRAALIDGEPRRYRDMEGGLSSYAFEVLLGRQSTEIRNRPRDRERARGAGLPWSKGEYLTYEPLLATGAAEEQLSGGMIAALQRMAAHQVFPSEDGARLAYRIRDFWKALYPVWSRVDKAMMALDRNSGEKYMHEVRREAVLKALEVVTFDSAIQPCVEEFVGKKFPGKRGTGRYSESQLVIYGRIKDQLDSGHPVTAAFPPRVGRPGASDGEAGPSGEPESKGLYGKHVYAVVGVSSTTRGALASKTKYIVLVNPHGRVGRTYNAFTSPAGSGDEGGRLTAVRGDAAVFSMELSDFCKRVERVAWNAAV